MRNTRQSRDRALIVLAVAGIVAVGPYALPLDDDADTWRIALLTIGGAAAAIAGMFAILFHSAALTQARLERGDGSMGRWRIGAAEWRAFVELERTFAAQPNVWQNEFRPREGAPSGEVEVILGKTAVVVDGSVIPLPLHGLPEVREARLRRDNGVLPSIELHLYSPPERREQRSIPARWATLRFPVAPDSGPAAMRYIDWCKSGRLGEATFAHGRGDGSDPEDVSTCRSCGWETHQFVRRCERCGGAMLSRRWARRLGAALIVIGVAIVGMTGFIVLDEWTGGLRWAGMRWQALAGWIFLLGIAGFGMVSAVNGAWMVKTGRRSMRVVRVSLAAVAVAIAIAVAVAAVARL